MGNTQAKQEKLFQACREGDLATVRALVPRDIDVNCVDHDLQTPLHLACYHGEKEIYYYLIKATHADINKADKWTRTPFIMAIMEGHEVICRDLVRRGVDPLQATAHNVLPLHVAAYWGQEVICRWLIEEFACDINHQDNDGNTALMGAARQGHPAIVRLLMQFGADVSLCNSRQEQVWDLVDASIGADDELKAQIRALLPKR